MRIFCLEDAFDSLIPNFWRDLWTNLTRVWPNNIRRIMHFIPVLWNDWDFDFRSGGFDIIRAKLVRLERTLENGNCLCGHRYAKQIRKVIFVIDRLVTDEYDTEELAKLEVKWGKSHIDFVPSDDGQFEVKTIFERGELSGEEEEEYRADTSNALKCGNERYERDSKFVFDMLNRWHRYWWD